LVLLVFLAGCNRSGIPTSVRPDEYAVYHAYLLRYATKNPEQRDHLYVYPITGEGVQLGEEERDYPAYLERCMPRRAILAFRKIGHHQMYPLDDTTLKGWRILPDSTSVPFFPNGASPARYT
jgi:hypothetical protein